MTTIHWAIGATGREMGNCLGYGTANVLWRAALERMGAIDDSSPVAFHFGHAALFAPIPGKINVLGTMFENPYDRDVLERCFRPAFEFADAIVTPSRFCVEMFRPLTDKPILVCPLGFEVERFRYRPRRWERGTPFVWGYVGAPNARKFSLLGDIWAAYLERRGDCRLYVKTTGADTSQLADLLARTPDVREVEPDLIVSRNVTFDNRMLPREALPDIYHRMHAFLFLHVGEGWGLTLLEAMATGLPVVATGYSGVLEYATARNAFLVKPRRVDQECIDSTGRTFTVIQHQPDPHDALDCVHAVMSQYRLAAWRGARAARDVATLTWDNAARRLLEIVDALWYCDSQSHTSRLSVAP